MAALTAEEGHELARLDDGAFCEQLDERCQVDTAEPLDFKASVLRQEGAVAGCERITVPVDLREDWPAAPP